MLDRILITNDDGIAAPGLEILEQIAHELAREVWVVAPEHDQSGISHAISLHDPVRITARGPRRYGVLGTPGDCAVMGVSHLMAGALPDLLLSGVNRGGNLGAETVFSGTVGGAMTGMLLGIPSIALSKPGPTAPMSAGRRRARSEPGPFGGCWRSAGRRIPAST